MHIAQHTHSHTHTLESKSEYDADAEAETVCDCAILQYHQCATSNGKHQMKAKRTANQAEHAKMPHKYAYDACDFSWVFFILKSTALIYIF